MKRRKSGRRPLQADDFDPCGIDRMAPPKAGLVLTGQRREKAVAEFLDWYAKAPAKTEIREEGVPLMQFVEDRKRTRGRRGKRVKYIRNT